MKEDLSNTHRPLTDTFLEPKTKEEWLRHSLTTEQLNSFSANGYLAGIPLLNEAQIEKLRAEVDELLNPSFEGRDLLYEYNTNESTDPSSVLFHALGAWRVMPICHDLLWNPAFLVASSQLLKASVRFWHDQIFYKPPHHGGVVAWHQDYSYWTRTRPMAHLSCWIGIDDSTVQNGCLHYVPGSHEWNLLPKTGLADDMDAIKSVLSEKQRASFKPVPIELPKGSASFHHPLMVHGSFENKTDHPRRAVVLNVFADGVLSASDERLLEGVPPIPTGEKMKGRFFPLLFDSRKLA